MPPPRVGFIGLGSLGKPMAIKVREAGFDLTVYDIKAESLDDLLKLGAKQAATPADLGRACDIIEIMVSNGAQVEDVISSPHGILAGARAGLIAVIHSTVGPDVCRRMAALTKTKNVHVLDAGVSGGVPAAQAGALSLMVGGEAEILEKCRPVFAAFANMIHFIGEIGSGQIAKILNNHAVYCNILTLNEVLHLAQQAGVAVDIMLKVLNSSSGRSFSSETWDYFRPYRQNYPTGVEGWSAMVDKDISLALDIAKQHGVPSPVIALASQYVSRGLGFDSITHI